jgi:hypothetical protein
MRVFIPLLDFNQHLADVVVAGDGGHAEQTLAVRAALPLRQGALMRQEGRTAHEEERERRQADVRHRIAAARLRPFAPVGKIGTDRAQFGNAVFKGTPARCTADYIRRGDSELSFVGFPFKRQIVECNCNNEEGCKYLDAVEKFIQASHIGFCGIEWQSALSVYKE